MSPVTPTKTKRDGTSRLLAKSPTFLTPSSPEATPRRLLFKEELARRRPLRDVDTNVNADSDEHFFASSSITVSTHPPPSSFPYTFPLPSTLSHNFSPPIVLPTLPTFPPNQANIPTGFEIPDDVNWDEIILLSNIPIEIILEYLAPSPAVLVNPELDFGPLPSPPFTPSASPHPYADGFFAGIFETGVYPDTPMPIPTPSFQHNPNPIPSSIDPRAEGADPSASSAEEA
ncbi:hypothetical protein CPB84DRAFT_1785768 [Gymnopilus junonius]|uniref:Uncharacterized protein n=1 Tax=Gymnopilus junonius TaxID=109634 RepID=A0A9P5TJP9_GYMJU|nr:hypothetical protein CPB84DRAFT_1785768 [Gymnopilus junonius]